MMKINGESKSSGIMPSMQGNDSVSKELQSQIADAQKELQELSKNDQLSSEEKMKKRQELNQRINELTNQLKQHQAELRKEKMAAAKAVKAESTQEQENEDGDTAGFSQEGMEAALTADSSLKLAQVKNGVKKRMQIRARIMESEIETDASRGASVEAKQKSLSKLEQRIDQVSKDLGEEVGNANQSLKEENLLNDRIEEKEDSEENNGKKEAIEDSTIDVRL